MESNIYNDPQPLDAQDDTTAPAPQQPTSASQPDTSVPQPEDAPERVKRRSYPNGYDILAIIGILVFSAVVSGIVLGITLFVWPAARTEHFELVNAAAYFVMMAAAIGLTLLHRHQRHAEPLRLFRTGRINSPLILYGIILIFISGIVIEPLLNLFSDQWLDMINNAIGTGGWSIMMTVVLAPVMEETLFRGIIQGSISQRYGAIAGITASALMFGAFHVIPQQAVNAFVVGLILGYIYYRSGSLSTVMFIHAANNAIAMLMLQVFGPENANWSLQDLISNQILYWIVYVVAVLLFGWSFVSTLRRLKLQSRTDEQQ